MRLLSVVRPMSSGWVLAVSWMLEFVEALRTPSMYTLAVVSS